MKFMKLYNSVLNQKNISRLLVAGLLLNNIPINAFASTLSEDGRYETFEGDNLTIPNVMEEENVDVMLEGNTLVNVSKTKDSTPITKKYDSVSGNSNTLNQATNYGKMEIGEVEGNTLVNYLSKPNSRVDLNSMLTIDDEYITIDFSKGNGKEKSIFLYLNHDLPLLPNKYYTYKFDIIQNTTKVKEGFENQNALQIEWGFQNTVTARGCISYSDKSSSVTKVVHTNNATSPSNRVGFYIRVGTGTEHYCESGILKLKKSFILLEGDYSNKPIPQEYFEGMKSTFEDKLVTEGDNRDKYEANIKVIGKNKFNIDKFISAYSGKPAIQIVKNNNSFTVTSTSPYVSNTIVDFGLDMTKKYTVNFTREGGGPSSFIVTQVSNGFNFYINPNTSCTISNLQIEEGDTVTSYEPYREYSQTLYLDEPLYKGNKLAIKDGVLGYWKNYEKIVFDGRNKWSHEVLDKNTSRFFTTLPNTIHENNTINIINDRFLYSSDVYREDIEGIYTCWGGIYFRINNNKLLEQSSNGFNQWLQNNPTTVIYKVAEPIFVPLQQDTPRWLLDSYNQCTLSFDTNIPVANTTFKSFTEELTYLQPNTNYAVTFNSDKAYDNSTITLGGISKTYNIVKGYNKIEFLTGNTIEDNLLVIDGQGINIEKVVVSTQESNGYFDGMKSVGQDDINGHKIEITSRGNGQYNTKEILLNEPLRGLPNGVKDRIIKKNGRWYIERNCEEVVFNGSEDEKWISFPLFENDEISIFCNTNIVNSKQSGGIVTSDTFPTSLHNSGVEGVWLMDSSKGINVNINKNRLVLQTVTEFKQWLQSNPITIIYPLETPIYEPLDIEPTLPLYSDITHISTNSTIPVTIKVTVDRTINRAKEALELVKINPTTEKLSQARYWINLLKESTLKDELQEEVNEVFELEDIKIEKKSSTANMDVYIKSENMVSMTLNTSQITFEDFSGVEDIEKNNAINVMVNSSLPYKLNAYLSSDIQNSDKSASMNNNILSIKENSEVDYQEFTNKGDKLVLKDNNSSGNNLNHNIDLKLNANSAFKADVYKTSIKLEVEQI